MDLPLKDSVSRISELKQLRGVPVSGKTENQRNSVWTRDQGHPANHQKQEQIPVSTQPTVLPAAPQWAPRWSEA